MMAILQDPNCNLVTFEQRKAKGQFSEDKFCQIMTEQGLQPHQIEGQFKPFDVYEKTTGTTYEIKSAWKAHQYGTAFVEVYRQINGVWQDYGLTATRADYWAFVTDRDIVVLATEHLKNIILIQRPESQKIIGEVDGAWKIRYKVSIEEMAKKGETWQL